MPKPRLPRDPAGAVFLVLLAAAAVAVPLLNLAVPAGSPLHVPTYAVTLLGKYLCYALLALAVDLVWGFAGILSLGHGAFFALGGYAMGMYLMRQIGGRGVYAHPVLPDFMVFLNWQELPWYWHGFGSFAFALLMVAAAPGLFAFVFGWFAFRSRVTGVYFSIITQAMTFALMLAFFRNDMGFGGNNGLTDFKDMLGFGLQADGTRAALCAASGLALALGFVACRWIVASRFGRVLVAIRDAESRARSLGYRVERYKLFVFTVSAVMAGIAGALYVPQVGIINPSEFSPAASIEIVVWVAVGGRGTLHGAALGAMLVNLAKTYFTAALPDLWLYALGALFIVVTLAMPRGIAGTLAARGGAAAATPAMTESARRPFVPGRTAAGSWSTDRSAAKGTMLYLDGVSVAFDGFKALDNLSLYILAGEMRAIIGPNGAGKTTMLDVITGRTRPDAGRVLFRDSIDLARLDEAEIADCGIGRKFQRPTVFENHTVAHNLELARRTDRRVAAVLFGRLSIEQRRRIDEVLHTVGLAAHHRRLAGSLSHGQKQWLEIGMLLMQEPDLLLVDEPVAGMTDAETEATADLLRTIAGSRSIIVVEHDMAFVRALGARVTVLHEGSVLSEGSMQAVQSDPRVIEVYLGR